MAKSIKTIASKFLELIEVEGVDLSSLDVSIYDTQKEVYYMSTNVVKVGVIRGYSLNYYESSKGEKKVEFNYQIVEKKEKDSFVINWIEVVSPNMVNTSKQKLFKAISEVV